MSLLSDNIIPGNYGKLFGTNTVEEQDLLYIKKRILEIDGVKRVEINNTVFPREFTVYTSKIVAVVDIENLVKLIGFNAIPQ
ncbi:heavy-metal-associated domain-containing protein [Flavobacterium cellulosilyticum]|uniref:Heavy-metal-associated domain-containing protein n=1 Tax=Flavobacterium cellulosilyticum TaxID=2541731 RepID=A0A4R5CB12_9FLAO|nr:heavy-metal-associated domain-containing protein [Flavobacterium cellulosilyticum]TDD94294.1 heavy-metal-associated domain-containing protein [Flavobacterium cellulosilyticum]